VANHVAEYASATSLALYKLFGDASGFHFNASAGSHLLGKTRGEVCNLYKLKKLELLGFKSFGDRSRLEFADGVAAIVGPNGCGKSNLSDAVSWVLGEQSAKSLRGERMADVIFNGTGTRPPTSMAEVSMTLVDPEYNEAGFAEEEQERRQVEAQEPEAAAGDKDGEGEWSRPPKLRHRAGEITVTRRLFRSGESEYLINGQVCRLRDIQDLFMGTGLGPESYAIIEQGRIGQVLSSRPSDRRLILEEAAGVSKFKTRKRLAEAKLESSRQNLARIADILEEVTKQVNSLKRQASKARRYREFHDELRARLKVVLTSRWVALEAQCARLGGEVAQAQEACGLAAQRLEALELEQKAATQKHEEWERQLTQLREQIAQSSLERERLLSRCEQVRQQAASLEGRDTDAARERADFEAQLASLEQQSNERTLQLEQVQQDWTAAQGARAQLLSRQDSLSNQVAATEEQVESCRQAMLAAVSHAAELRNQLVQAEEAGLALSRQATRTESEKQRVEREHQRWADELEVLIAAQQQDTTSLADLAKALSETVAALEQARGEEAFRRSALETLRREHSGAVARKQALEESLARHAYSTESVRRLLTGEIPTNGHQFHPLGVLADFVEVSPGYEEVVEDFLKLELECVVVEQHEQARSGIALLREEGKGWSTFFVTHIPPNDRSYGQAHADLLAEPGVVAQVRDLISFQKSLGLNGDLGLPTLANAYLVEDPATAQRLAGAYPECHFLTRTGEHYQHRLVSGGKGSSAGPLALRRDFRKLERRTAELEGKIQASEAALAEAASRVTQLAENHGNLTAAKQEAEKRAVVANEKTRQVREAWERACDQLKILQSEAAALQRELATADERKAGLRSELGAAGHEKTRREEAITQSTGALRGLRMELERLSQELAEASARSSALEERTRAAGAEVTRLLGMCEDVRSRMTRLQQQSESWREQRQRLAEEGETSRVRLHELEAVLEMTRLELQHLEQESGAVKAQRVALSPQVDAARVELETHRAKRSEADVAFARADSDRTHHAQQCREELHAEPSAVLAELPPQSVLAGEILLAAEGEVHQLKTRIENLGPVNMMALEELQEAEDRLTFLDTQRQDLLASIEDTSQAIREIDQVSRQQFLEAFQAINGYFAETFHTLFGGGVGEMRLTDELDADSGIDIAAQPPGKRLQNVLLLSGGEKALAALALLIAIFRYTPSPFCILDEVDAPLDESNIDRFSRMVEQMSRHTQFILITHSKRTMEIARVMYGVTMEEPGVSKLVSVRFESKIGE
jgi:chromosome segregation protein